MGGSVRNGEQGIWPKEQRYLSKQHKVGQHCPWNAKFKQLFSQIGSRLSSGVLSTTPYSFFLFTILFNFLSIPPRPHVFMLRIFSFLEGTILSSFRLCSITLPRWHFLFLRRMSGEGKISDCLMGFQVQKHSSLHSAALVSTGAGSDLALMLKDTDNFSSSDSLSQHAPPQE